MMPSSAAHTSNKVIGAQVALRGDQMLLQRQLPLDNYGFVRESVQRGVGCRGVNRCGWLVHIYYTVRDTVHCFHQGYEKLKEGRKKKIECSVLVKTNKCSVCIHTHDQTKTCLDQYIWRYLNWQSNVINYFCFGGTMAKRNERQLWVILFLSYYVICHK